MTILINMLGILYWSRTFKLYTWSVFPFTLLYLYLYKFHSTFLHKACFFTLEFKLCAKTLCNPSVVVFRDDICQFPYFHLLKLNLINRSLYQYDNRTKTHSNILIKLYLISIRIYVILRSVNGVNFRGTLFAFVKQ